MQKEEIEKIINTPFFFIIGRPRSGTTLLRTMFDAHPNFCIPLEHSNLIHLQYKFGRIKYWDTKIILSLFHEFTSNKMIKHWTYDKAKLKKNLLSAPKKSSFSDLIKIIYSHYESVFPKNEQLIIGDKSPLNSLYLKKLYNGAFTEAKFIYLSRDPRDNISSIKKLRSKGFSPSIDILANGWKQSAHQFLYMLEKVPQQILFLRYEDLIVHPKEELLKICDFLNIPFDKNMLNYHKTKQNYSADFIENYQKKLFSPPDKKNHNNWKKELTVKEVKKIEYQCRYYMEKFNYEQSNKEYSLLFRLSNIPVHLIILYQNMNRYFFDLLPLKIKKKIRMRKIIITRSLYLLFKKK
jgi:hypothetical protein